MKTINDLVDKLNRYGVYGEYYVRKRKAEVYLLYKRYTLGEDVALFCFAKEYPYWSIYADLGSMRNKVQKDIMDFIYTTDKEHWFDEPEKKYNIVIGEDVGTYGDCVKTAYRKKDKGIEVWDSAKESSFTSDRYIFTESEIEELKATLPANMKKIVELGKVEVKDD